MNRYVAIVNLPDHWGAYYAAGGETVIETDKTPVRTGLLDANGVPLYRVPETVPLGFQPPARKPSGPMIYAVEKGA